MLKIISFLCLVYRGSSRNEWGVRGRFLYKISFWVRYVYLFMGVWCRIDCYWSIFFR